MDEKRIKSIKNYITKSVHIEQNVQPIVNTCLVGMLKAAENIDPQKVSSALRFLLIGWTCKKICLKDVFDLSFGTKIGL